MIAPKFEVGKSYINEKGSASVTVLAIIGGRLITKADGGYYMLHTLKGEYIGHYWDDSEETRRSVPTKPFYPASLQGSDSVRYYNIVLPKPEPVVTMRRLLSNANGTPFWGCSGPVNSFTAASPVWTDALLVEVSIDGKVTDTVSLKEFKSSKYWEMLK